MFNKGNELEFITSFVSNEVWDRFLAYLEHYEQANVTSKLLHDDEVVVRQAQGKQVLINDLKNLRDKAKKWTNNSKTVTYRD